MNKSIASIFSRYYLKTKFKDRFLLKEKNSVDVIIPVVHTNELWKTNLYSFYREIPINRLLIGDGGCIDNSIDIVRKFPRVKIFDQKKYKTLGYSVKKLIENVSTEWFIYLHSDVYLPGGWFNAMKKHQKDFDWFGAPMINTVMVDYPDSNNFSKVRPFAGSQMGRKTAFEKGLKNIDDDYVYRQEDFVFSNLVEKAGFKHGRIDDTYHYHQTMFRQSRWMRKIKKVSLELEIDQKEEFRTHDMQVRGFIKYLDPNPYFAAWITSELASLQELGKLNWEDFINWVKKTNPAWLPYLKYWRIQLVKIWQSYTKKDKLKNKLMKIFFNKKLF
ncbi:MAG: hypothetical protein A2857_04955 [Candidatus Levybacteria bacterium RIFCSPHIGHO2_01_FULL_36_15]|nr:MAG: hypothetical protein A2857_04955 [Candidatus Levybacteria bacterium RIFCSPHIGHO2_01_FULL_36_15]